MPGSPTNSAEPTDSERQRFTRFDGDLPEIQSSFRLDGRLDVVFLTNGHATAGDDAIRRLAGFAQRFPGGLERIGDDPEIDGGASQGFDQSTQQKTVGVINLCIAQAALLASPARHRWKKRPP